jgi:hypothetical protein
MDGETTTTETHEALLAAGCERVTLRLSRDTLGRPIVLAFAGGSPWSVDGGAVGTGRTIAAALDALVRHAQAIAALRAAGTRADGMAALGERDGAANGGAA